MEEGDRLSRQNSEHYSLEGFDCGWLLEHQVESVDSCLAEPKHGGVERFPRISKRATSVEYRHLA